MPLEEAARTEPGNVSALCALGLILLDAKRFDDAFAAFDHALAAHPGDALALFGRARAHRQFGRSEEAFRDMRAALERNPILLARSIPALRHAGYWNSGDNPTTLTPDLLDGIRACMMDVTCN